MDKESAINTDIVARTFFMAYKELISKLEEALQKAMVQNSYIKKEFEEKNIKPVDFAKKLLGQIVFLYFLQKKGWLGVTKNEDGQFKKWGTGPKNFLRKLFEKEIVPYNNFYDEILEPLFYEAMATARDDDYYTRFECKIPFLHDELFKPINDYNWAGIAIGLDNKIFDQILSTFDRFNFSVKEDEPLDKKVAVDPEMLGKVFESLLEVQDRKSKGTFYTPREIVHYMCQECLLNYLEINTPISRTDIEQFIQLGNSLCNQIPDGKNIIKIHNKMDKFQERNPFLKSIREQYLKIDELLKVIKIVDPAVGSGAFLIGMLNEIVKIRSILSNYFGDIRNNYDLKRETIENCLYGVDIESSAVDIAKLRLWLSLIVDEIDTINLKPLPNLNQKIMCGNSLIEDFELFDEKLVGSIQRDKFRKIFSWKKNFNEAFHRNNPGFDVVISNPPYIDSETMVKQNNNLRELYSKIFQSAKGNWDLFILFIEKGMNLLRQNGVMSYIIPNKLIGAKYSESIRKLLIKKNMKEVRDYSLVNIFKEADVYPVTFILLNNSQK
ncbi:MAG TPA: N-6 DNA methylase, partial [Candidatus Deferrimicrobium sp.]|nr:N-6 DNA methylase [Candidatus Deferrimicrobium sp.]